MICITLESLIKIRLNCGKQNIKIIGIIAKIKEQIKEEVTNLLVYE